MSDDFHSIDWPAALLEQARDIRMVVFDVDGVMTDGRLYRDDAGNEIKAFHSRDGLGMKGLMNSGYRVAVLTARRSRLVEHRMTELGIELFEQGRHDKGEAFNELLSKADIQAANTAYMGDDLVDWPAMSQAALKVCPADADAWICGQADYITQARAGRGAVRELCELLLNASGQLADWRAGFGIQGKKKP